MAVILKVEDLHKSYDDLKVLDGITFEVSEGEFFAIVGPSGCGKTTLLKIIAGLEDYDAGRVLVDGEEVREPGPDRALVFQEYAIFPWKTVLENVMFAPLMQGKDPEEAERIARECLKVVPGLEGFEDAYPKQLSGGMKQRVAIARALAAEPRILLMDEPFAAVDAQTRNKMQEELLKIWERTGQTILLVTHNVEEAVFLADRVMVLSPRPAEIVDIVEIDLPRPRDRTDPEFVELRARILDMIGSR
ncbi:ABC transporter ATP-binding protein [Methanopyrus kandleri]|uniref:Molybdate/tungstate import ATP-binding protein WtpC n=2 Tax=Methanopyrus kandleri TaxID=2320 RepID=Q8TXQ7_METKA|nr:ABC transporter ATP-binding protein [Methanopyrus kandleri]AAM01818.1 Homolog of ABC-type nitrate/sulfonate/taurine/bicarbonate transport systems, ATPase component [Methanopyrus kandleri AV19]HII70175.1 ABC transporter ATP-binding protein [Methanopyrus kandleri]